MPKEVMTDMLGRLAGDVNTDVMSEVEAHVHGKLWHFCRDWLFMIRHLFHHPI